MEHKVKVLAERFVKLMSGWDGVECITLNEAALPGTLDPYFALIMDVFCSGGIPGPAQREEQYGKDIVAFESTGRKDRFLTGSIPVRFEFKDINETEELVSVACTKNDMLHLKKDSGTYTYYRLSCGEVLFSRQHPSSGQWLDGIRSRLKDLPPDFWRTMRSASQSKMEHLLSDMGAALIQNDGFCYLTSASGFIKNACLTLFNINKRFEPAPRQYYEQVIRLPVLPPGFEAHAGTFLRISPESTMERKYSAARLIARGIVNIN